MTETKENIKTERSTKQKRTVTAVFEGLRNHPSAEMVCDEVKKVDPTIGRATVYRVLNSLVEKGLAIRVPIDDGSFRYDITVKDHSHAKCKICGAVCDVVTDSLYPTVIDGFGFEADSAMVLFFGYCQKCKNKK